MNIEDIQSLQERINRITLGGASPYVIIASNPEVHLKQYARSFQANRYTVLALYNEYRGRTIMYPTMNSNNTIITNSGILHIGHIIACISATKDDIDRLIDDLSDTNLVNIDMKRQLLSLFSILEGDRDIIIEGTASILVHKYITDILPSIDMVALQDLYTRLKGMTNMAGKVLSQQAIVGGIIYAYPNVPTNAIYSIVSRLEHETSPYRMTNTNIIDAVEWYKDQLDMKISQQAASFYERSLLSLMSIPTIPMQMYDPEIELERVIIRSTYPLDIIDLISNAYTSPDIPIMIANVEGKKIIKVYNKVETMKKIELEWFMEAKKVADVYGTMSIVIRISRYPDKYHLIQYNNNKNHFSMNKTRRFISISEIITILSSHLNINTLIAPSIPMTTYSFVSNYIVGKNDQYGIDRHILAWLITNPPEQYRDANIDKFIFIKEDTKPNAMRDHISIHMQLGAEKVYITISIHSTTTGTIVPVPHRIPAISAADIDLIGFDRDQKYIQVRVNRAPTIHHARIAQSLYMHIISMYMQYYRQTRSTIYTIAGISLPILDPKVLPLVEREPDLRERFSYFDNVLYKYVSDINPDLLPVPIERGEVQLWRNMNYDVMKLPTIVINNPLIKIETAGELWIRTPNVGRFVLHEKKEGGYIPIMSSNRIGNNIMITVNSDMSLTDIQIRSRGESYVLKEYKSLSNKPGRVAFISKATLEILSPILPTGISISSIRRIGISLNIVYALNNALGRSISPIDIAQYAHLCMQENWEQSVSEIYDDIASQRIHPLRHFRAIEQAYRINMYFLLDDLYMPYLRKPPHTYFYLHRVSNDDWPTLILHSLSSEPDILSLIIADTGRGTRGYRYLFDGHNYLDDLMNRSNVTRMVSPTDGINEILHTIPIVHDMDGWIAHEQIVDTYGKCRAITYKKNDLYATINIGFAPVQNLPIGNIRYPSNVIIQDIPSLKDLILYPTADSDLSRWIKSEKDARVLRIVAHLLYSQMDISLDEFFDMVIVDDTIVYDTSNITHALPNIQGSYEKAWEYFSMVTSGIVDIESYTITVPNDATWNALYLHMKATPKIRWPTTFPSYVLYEWDIRSNKDEMVFLRDADLVQYIIMSRSPNETSTIVPSVHPYILSRGDHKYLVQMASSIRHAKYIAYVWDENEDGPTNPGYECVIMDVEYPWREVSYDFTDHLDAINFTKKDGRIYVIIPI